MDRRLIPIFVLVAACSTGASPEVFEHDAIHQTKTDRIAVNINPNTKFLQIEKDPNGYTIRLIDDNNDGTRYAGCGEFSIGNETFKATHSAAETEIIGIVEETLTAQANAESLRNVSNGEDRQTLEVCGDSYRLRKAHKAYFAAFLDRR